MLALLNELKKENIISELNYQFAKLIDRKQQNLGYTLEQQNLAILLSALVSFHVMQGHSCIRLDSHLANNPFGLQGKNLTRPFYQEILQKIGEISPLAWQETLKEHIAFSQDPEQVAPMLFQYGRVYFYRYWQAENRIAHYLQQAVSSEQYFANVAQDREILAQFFEPQSEIDWQKVAVATALNNQFCLISGGPGTGKTRTVAILLAALQQKQLKQGLAPLQIALAAPTGKAAARLKESITNSLRELNLPQTLQENIPTSATTIHSLIGITPHSDLPRYHAQNPLHLDLLVVDEASMIDMFVMEKLCNALKPETRLIMLGDKDQLASVEVGNAMAELGDLIQFDYSPEHSDYLTQVTGYPIFAKTPHVPAICDSLCHLRRSFRFNENSGIGRVAAEVNAKQAVKSWQYFTNADYADLQLHTYPNITEFSEKSAWIQHCVNMVTQKAVALYRAYLDKVKARTISPEKVSVSEIFAEFQKVRFLSALRVTELGVERLNQTIAEALQQAGLVQFKHSRDSYIGKPILITENAPQLSIFSGDIGLILPDEAGKLRVYFETKKGDKHLELSPSRLPSYEPAYVMTVHKSQGSEFEHALLVMPLNIAPVLTKELVYTAITRAKSAFTLFSDEKVWKQAVKAEVQRQSGLQIQLLGK
ncbi:MULTISPECIES: exodeoxyribonuclease V subunit alpha [Glaesserella]|uniref:RecBCD enzyme subunit RecD n=1 Tax=Glaesserella australis TaxID=2094024 RepID=A0A328BW21_9PAST|nr:MULTISPECIES: exodeoxyribonuclease V subunit alpha [Glaesserella]AUI67171.1 exodeoxyribonuclease V subunit alpha [Glaesserella sp. 15-184]RAL18373.1 exodeoxyribonuclease V subunit alpha [Glaesserella australis]